MAIKNSICGIVCCALFAVGLPQHVAGDVIWMQGQQEPVYGVVTSSNDKQVVLNQTSDGTSFESTTISRSSIRVMVVNHDAARLSALMHGQWKAWLDYAEELHSQKRDPTARNLAIRLLLVVIANSNNLEQRSVALTSLVTLARNDNEREAFSQLMFLETGKKGARQEVQPDRPPHTLDARVAAADLVRRVRLQKALERPLGDDLPERKVISSYEDICSWKELEQVSKTNRIDVQSMKHLVALELALRSTDTDQIANAAKPKWHQLAKRIGTSTLRLPTVENVTEFDPSATRYVDGKWTKR